MFRQGYVESLHFAGPVAVAGADFKHEFKTGFQCKQALTFGSMHKELEKRIEKWSEGRLADYDESNQEKEHDHDRRQPPFLVLSQKVPELPEKARLAFLRQLSETIELEWLFRLGRSGFFGHQLNPAGQGLSSRPRLPYNTL